MQIEIKDGSFGKKLLIVKKFLIEILILNLYVLITQKIHLKASSCDF